LLLQKTFTENLQISRSTGQNQGARQHKQQQGLSPPRKIFGYFTGAAAFKPKINHLRF